MNIFGKNPDRDLIVVAEVGVNHEGDPGWAKQLIGMASTAGATAVKLQVGKIPETDTFKRRGNVYDLEPDDLRGIVAWNDAEGGCPLFASALSLEALELCDELFPVIKIASRSIRDQKLLTEAGKLGKPVILSTGRANSADISQALYWLETRQVVLMHCVSAYPTPIEQANTRSVEWLKANFRLPVGYSNHVIGKYACLSAVAMGATVLEVHFTDDKRREFRDHKLSFDCVELMELVRESELIKESLGRFTKTIQPCEAT